MIVELLIFIFLWFTMCGLWHEVMHLIELERQGNDTGCMWVSFNPLPGMACAAMDVEDDDMFSLSGGAYTSIICFLLVFLFDGFVSWTFLTLGYVQLMYGCFEMKYIDALSSETFRSGRYIIYGSVVTVMMLIYIYSVI